MARGLLCAAFARCVQHAIYRVGEIAVEWGHLVLGDGILDRLERGLFGGLGGGGISELEDMLRELEVGIFGELRVAHSGSRDRVEGGEWSWVKVGGGRSEMAFWCFEALSCKAPCNDAERGLGVHRRDTTSSAAHLVLDSLSQSILLPFTIIKLDFDIWLVLEPERSAAT